MAQSCVQLIFVIVLILSLITQNKSQIHVDDNESVFNNLINSTTSVLDQINILPQLLIHNIFNRYNDNNNINNNNETDAVCNKQLELFGRGLELGELWALKMVDASSKIPSGILNGNNKDLGMYDECMSIEEIKENDTVRGRHCMYTLSAVFDLSANESTPMTLTLSACLPSSCNPDQIKSRLQSAINMIGIYLNEFPMKWEINSSVIQITDVSCSSIDSIPWTSNEIIFITFLTIFMVFLITCTVSEILIINKYINNTENKILNGLSKFSLYKNSLSILSTRVPKENLSSITGLRFFSMAWVVLGHNYIQPLFGALVNFVDVGDWMYSWKAVYILIAPYAVDTFFVMSGFLTAYLFIKEMNKGCKFNIFSYYIHRYVRLTPVLAILLLITIYIIPRIGSGALWDPTINSQADACSRSWWKILLYIQNYATVDALTCLGHTWYLAVDMQFFWLSPFILYPLAKRPKIGLVILITLIIVSTIVPATIAGINKYSGALYHTSDLESMADAMVNFYVTSHTRAGPWLLGIYLGYVFHNKKEVPRKNIMRLGWFLTFLALAFIFFTERIFQNKNYEYNIYYEVLYAAFARHIWSFAVCWIIFASSNGYGGIIAKLLSFSIFLPFGRISYSVYLVHYIIQGLEAHALRVPLFFSDLQMISHFFRDFILSVIIGFVFTLCFESPFLVLEKMIMGGSKKSDQYMNQNNSGNSENIIHNNNNGISNNSNNNNNINKIEDDLNQSTVENGIDNYGYKDDEDCNYSKNNSNNINKNNCNNGVNIIK